MGDNTTNSIHVILGFFEFDFSPDIFTRELGLSPHYKGVRGEKYLVGLNKDVEKVYEYNFWRHEMKVCSNDFIGDVVAKYIDELILPRVNIIKRLTNGSNVQLKVVQYYYQGCNPGLHIAASRLSKLADINCSLDLDLYCLADAKVV